MWKLHTSLIGISHPLQELTVPSFVANDTLIIGGAGEESEPDAGDQAVVSQAISQLEPRNGPSMLLLTGPNYSGKSVYLKQVAIITFMAHVGR